VLRVKSSKSKTIANKKTATVLFESEPKHLVACANRIRIISYGTYDYERGAKIRLNLLSTSYEAFKEKGQFDPETTTSLV